MYESINERSAHPSQSECTPRSTSSRRRKTQLTMREDRGLPPAARRSWPLYSTGRTQSLLYSQPGKRHRTQKQESITDLLRCTSGYILNIEEITQKKNQSLISFLVAVELHLERERMHVLIFFLSFCTDCLHFKL